MFLSMIVPVYNGETYLASCLDSLLGQDIPAEEYEIICIDDGSVDSSASILDRYAGAHPNLQVIHRENDGVATARNRGVDDARGDYIWFVDCDDLIAPNCLAGLKSTAESTHCDRLIVGAYQFTDELTEDETKLLGTASLPANAPWYDSVVWRCLIRRDFLEENALSFRYPELTHGEDGLYMYELTACAPRDAQTESVLYLYRVHSGSAETSASTAALMKRLCSHMRIAQIMLDYYHSGRKDAPTADKLMSFLWLSLYEIARLPAGDAAAALKQLRSTGLYPFRRPAECTITRSYMSGRSGIMEKIFDFIYLRLHWPAVFTALRLIFSLRR